MNLGHWVNVYQRPSLVTRLAAVGEPPRLDFSITGQVMVLHSRADSSPLTSRSLRMIRMLKWLTPEMASTWSGETRSGCNEGAGAWGRGEGWGQGAVSSELVSSVSQYYCWMIATSCCTVVLVDGRNIKLNVHPQHRFEETRRDHYSVHCVYCT